MKIGVILLLVAGPFAALAQQPGVSFGWKPPVLKLPGTPGRGYLSWNAEGHQGKLPLLLTIQQLDSLRMLLPDRMPCLMLAGVDSMPTDRRKSTDPMPNRLKRVTIVTSVRPVYHKRTMAG